MMGSEKKSWRFLSQFSRKTATSFKRSTRQKLGSIVFTEQGKMIVSNLRRLSWSLSSSGISSWSMNCLVFLRYVSVDQCQYKDCFLPWLKVCLIDDLNLRRTGLYNVLSLTDLFFLLLVDLFAAGTFYVMFETSYDAQLKAQSSSSLMLGSLSSQVGMKFF